jgi:hypothetical protein
MKQTRLLKILATGAICAGTVGTALAQRGMQQMQQVPQGPSFQQEASSFQQIPHRQQQQQTTNSKTTTATMATTAGTIATYAPGSDHFMFRPSPNAAPVRYYRSRDTVIVDAQGHSVDQAKLRPGVEATMYYTPWGNRKMVRKIVIGHPTATAVNKAARTTKKY